MPMYKDLPRFVLGLSMGGLTAYHLSLADPTLFDGVILMAPAMMNSVRRALVSLTKVFSKIMPEKMRLTKPIYGRASRNPVIT